MKAQQTTVSHIVVTGMTCSACHETVKTAIVEAFKSQNIHVLGEVAFEAVSQCFWVKYAVPINVSALRDSLASHISEVGFTFDYDKSDLEELVWRPSQQGPISYTSFYARSMAVSLGIGLPLMSVHFWMSTVSYEVHWIMAIVSLVGMLVGGQPYWRPAWHEMTDVRPGMNALIAVACLSAWGYSLLSLVFPGLGTQYFYFDVAVLNLAIISLGKWLNERVKNEIDAALNHQKNPFLERLKAPENITYLQEGAASSTVDYATWLKNKNGHTTILVKSGDIIPVDGCLILSEGHAVAIDQESKSGDAQKALTSGAWVYRGDINKSDQTIAVQVKAVEKECYLVQQYLNMQTFESSSQPSWLQRASTYFAWGLWFMALATATFWIVYPPIPLWSHVVSNTLAVLFAACPCVLGLAAVIAYAVGMKHALNQGILVRHPQAFDVAAGHINTLVLDKTGTLTTCAFKDEHFFDATEEQKSLYRHYMAALEQHSDHPVARALKAKYTPGSLSWSSQEVETLRSQQGLKAVHDGKNYYIAAVSEDFFDLEERHRTLLRDIVGRGHRAVAFGYQEGASAKAQIAGVIELSDEFRPEAVSVLKELKAMGWYKDLVVLTGSSHVTELSGLNFTSHVNQTPDQKRAFIQGAKTKGTVAFLGDGLNDGPGAQQADLRMAIGRRQALSHQAHTQVIFDRSLDELIQFVRMSRLVHRNIRYNIAWAIVYNVTAIGLSTGMFYQWVGCCLISPMTACAMMAGSSLVVVLHSYYLLNQLQHQDAPSSGPGDGPLPVAHQKKQAQARGGSGAASMGVLAAPSPNDMSRRFT